MIFIIIDISPMDIFRIFYILFKLFKYFNLLCVCVSFVWSWPNVNGWSSWSYTPTSSHARTHERMHTYRHWVSSWRYSLPFADQLLHGLHREILETIYIIIIKNWKLKNIFRKIKLKSASASFVRKVIICDTKFSLFYRNKNRGNDSLESEYIFDMILRIIFFSSHWPYLLIDIFILIHCRL